MRACEPARFVRPSPFGNKSNIVLPDENWQKVIPDLCLQNLGAIFALLKVLFTRAVDEDSGAVGQSDKLVTFRNTGLRGAGVAVAWAAFTTGVRAGQFDWSTTYGPLVHPCRQRAALCPKVHLRRLPGRRRCTRC